MTQSAGKWSDLLARLGSAGVMIAVGFGAIIAGGAVFAALVAIICGLMVWELVRMFEGDAPASAWGPALHLGALSGAALIGAIYLPPVFALPVLLAPALVGARQMQHHRTVFLGFAALVLLAGFAMARVRQDMGLDWMMWLVGVVVVTDVMGYFAGRLLGGPRFWPKVSPKKTWSGTAGGWIGAALVGAAFLPVLGGSVMVVGMSVLVAMASQAGDIAESAIKRQMGVKDSSALIPGHGGLLDRFDGMLGAFVFVLAASLFIDLATALG
jgi:phosphatidate cytidylyltransferase